MKLREEQEAISRKYKGSLYTKIKFSGGLSDYDFLKILKIIEHINDFGISDIELRDYMIKYKLRLPETSSSYEQLLNEIKSHSYFCIQDNKQKRYIDYFSHKHYVPSLLMNERIRNFDRSINHYREVNKNGNLDGVDLELFSQEFADLISLINSDLFNFHFKHSCELGIEPSLEECRTFFPCRNFFANTRNLHGKSHL